MLGFAMPDFPPFAGERFCHLCNHKPGSCKSHVLAHEKRTTARDDSNRACAIGLKVHSYQETAAGLLGNVRHQYTSGGLGEEELKHR